MPLVYNLLHVSDGSDNDDTKDTVHENRQQQKRDKYETTIFINQISKRQSAQVDVGYVMWPSAIILSRWLISNPHVIKEKVVLELGAGCGLVGIVAARIISSQNSRRIEDGVHQEEDDSTSSGSQQVIITDVNELVIENIQQNIILNDMSSIACVAKLDFYVQTGTNHSGKWIASKMNGSSTSADDNDVEEEVVTDIDGGDIRDQGSSGRHSGG